MLNSVDLHQYLATDSNTTKLSRNKDLSENPLLIYHFRVKYHGRNELNSEKNNINHKIYNKLKNKIKFWSCQIMLLDLIYMIFVSIINFE